MNPPEEKKKSNNESINDKMEPTLKVNSQTNANADEFLVICSNSGLIDRPLCGITTETACVDDWKLLGFLTGQKRRVLHRLNRSEEGTHNSTRSRTCRASILTQGTLRGGKLLP
jgi:hypothetical protein